MTKCLRRKYFRIENKAVNNVKLNLDADLLIPSQINIGDWLPTARSPARHWSPVETLHTRNKLINLRKFVAGEPDYAVNATSDLFSITSVNYDFEPESGEPTEWLAFLDSIWGDDQQSKDLLQEWFGYMLTPDNSQQKLFLMLGPKRAGKGVILRILKKLVGEENFATPNKLSQLVGDFGLEPLLGKTGAIIGKLLDILKGFAAEKYGTPGPPLGRDAVDVNQEPPLLIDTQMLRDAFDRDWDFFKEIVDLFVIDCPRMIDLLRESLKAGDAAAFSRSAHAVKGMVRLFQAEEAAMMAQSLEEKGRNGDLDGAATAVDRLAVALDRLKSGLTGLLNERLPEKK